MTNQKTYLEGIKTKCPNCGYINIDLITYQIYNLPSQKFVGDFIMSEIENDMGFLNAFTYCDNCGKRYSIGLGIKKNRITRIVIVNKDE